MRVRLARCGGVPQWEAELGVWTMPRSTLQLVVAEVVAAFGRAVVAIEVKGDDVGSTWLTYEVCQGPAEALSDLFSGEKFTQTETQ
jgi:hypothetical protein